MPFAPVTIVTGAGSGIGRALCRRLSGIGHRLTLVGRDEKKLEQTLEGIAADVAEPPEMLIVPADLVDEAQCGTVIDMTAERWGRVDALVNNAAVLEAGPLPDIDADGLFRVFAANVFGPFCLTVRLWPLLVRQGAGRVVNVSSVAAVDPFPGLAAYAATKSAIESLARSICAEGREHGILGFAVAPGAVETPMLRSLISEDDLPPTSTLDPDEIAAVIEACVAGERDEDAGGVIAMPSG